MLSGDVDLQKDPLKNPNSDEIEANFTVAISALHNPNNWTWVCVIFTQSVHGIENRAFDDIIVLTG